MFVEVHKLYNLNNVVRFLRVLVVTTCTENFKCFKKGYITNFTIFQNTT